MHGPSVLTDPSESVKLLGTSRAQESSRLHVKRNRLYIHGSLPHLYRRAVYLPKPISRYNAILPANFLEKIKEHIKMLKALDQGDLKKL